MAKNIPALQRVFDKAQEGFDMCIKEGQRPVLDDAARRIAGELKLAPMEVATLLRILCRKGRIGLANYGNGNLVAARTQADLASIGMISPGGTTQLRYLPGLKPNPKPEGPKVLSDEEKHQKEIADLHELAEQLRKSLDKSGRHRDRLLAKLNDVRDTLAATEQTIRAERRTAQQRIQALEGEVASLRTIANQVPGLEAALAAYAEQHVVSPKLVRTLQRLVLTDE